MSIPTKWMDITLRDGKQLRFQFPVQFGDENIVHYAEETLKLPTVSIKADDILYVIPTSAIQLITISPAPKKLPKTTIHGAKLVE